MTIYQSCSDICNQAKNKLDGKYGAVTLFAIFYYVLMLNAQTIFSSLSASLSLSISQMLGQSDPGFISILMYLFGILYTILLGMVRAGMALYFLNLVCGGQFFTLQLFEGYRNDFKRTFLLSLIITLIQEVCMLPYQYVSYLQLTRGELLLIPRACTYLLGTLLFTLALLRFALIFYLQQDFPDLTVRQLLQKSAQIMKGHKIRYLKLQLRFLPLFLLGKLSFDIGLIWVLPYVNTATALFFLDVMNARKQQ